MQGRAAAVYGLVFLLVAAGAFAYVSAAEAPEPTMQSPEHEGLAQGDEFAITNDDGEERAYSVGEFSEQRGQPAVTMIWTDDDARATEDWEHVEEPGQPNVVYEGDDYYVRIEEQGEDHFVLQQAPPEDGNVSLVLDEDSGNWLVNADGNYTLAQNYDGLNRVEISSGDSFEEGAEDEVREVTVEEVTNDTVSVSWNEPAENEVILRQTDRGELNGQNVTVHFPGDDTVDVATDESEIERYLAAHDDREHFQQRTDGLIATTVLALVTLLLLIGLTQLPRKE